MTTILTSIIVATLVALSKCNWLYSSVNCADGIWTGLNYGMYIVERRMSSGLNAIWTGLVSCINVPYEVGDVS